MPKIKYINSCQNCRTLQSCDRCHSDYPCSKYDPMNELGLKPKKSKTMCYGCREQYYNDNQPKGCWHYKDAKVIAKLDIPNLTMRPPYYAMWALSCFHKQYH